MASEATHRPRSGAAYPEGTSPAILVAGRVSTDGLASGLLPLTNVVRTWQDRSCSACEHLWLVSSLVRETYATHTVAPGPYPNLDSNGAVISNRSAMRLRVMAGTSAGGDPEYEIDLGQAFEFYAERVTVGLLASQGTQEVITGTSRDPAFGLLFQSQVAVRLLRLEEHSSATEALLTETVYVARAEIATVRVPFGARRLTLYGEQAIFPVMRWIRNSSAAAPLLLGIVDWDPLRPRQEIDVPSASHLRINADLDTDRTFTLVWEISP